MNMIILPNGKTEVKDLTDTELNDLISKTELFLSKLCCGSVYFDAYADDSTQLKAERICRENA